MDRPCTHLRARALARVVAAHCFSPTCLFAHPGQAISFEMLRALFDARLVATELEVQYVPVEAKKVDFVRAAACLTPTSAG